MSENIALLIRDPDNRRSEATLTLTTGLNVDGPLLSCLMVSRGDRFPAAFAIECFQRQTYANRELIVVTAAPDSGVEALIAELADPAIRFIQAVPRPLGELRNVVAAHARGELIAQWDDDDLSAPDRLAMMAGVLGETGSRATFLRRVTLWSSAQRRIGPSARRLWENSMLVLRGALPAYPAVSLSEDTAVAQMIAAHNRVTLIDAPDRYCYVAHGRNSWGDDHFDLLFDAADGTEPLPDYDAHIAAIDARMPLRRYAMAQAKALE